MLGLSLAAAQLTTGGGTALSPAIPRPQSQRVALYEQRFGKFDSGKNAYWSLRKGRPVSLAEGARFDQAMRAGKLAPVVRRPARPPPMRRRLGYPDPRGLKAPVDRGYTLFRGPQPILVYKPPIAPQERLTTMPIEARRLAALPASPPPGPAVAPKEPMFDAIMRQLQEKRAGPAIAQPTFAAPGRAFAVAAPAPAIAGFDMKKLILPAVLVAGAFAVSKML